MKMVIFSICIIFSISHASFLGMEKRRRLRSCSVTNNFYEVHIINDLPSNTGAPNSSLPLHLHCASDDDDLGYHYLLTQRDFHWSFCMNIWGTTRFICELWWDITIAKSFVAFNFDIGLECNTTCNWIAKHDGLYFTGNQDPAQGLVKRYYWSEFE